jgi:arginyl-tRNA--protein-N-Asp/Glu arginylyltransferase
MLILKSSADRRQKILRNYLMYKSWQKTNLDNLDYEAIEEKYAQGFVLTRIFKEMDQVKSLRVVLEKFAPSSENRRILRKGEEIEMRAINLPMPLESYDWKIHAAGAQFYNEKFGPGTFSANKIKELITGGKSNFNCLLIFSDKKTNQDIGWSICFLSKNILHYAYPFYNLSYNNLGIIMMTKTMEWASGQKIKFCYLGSIWNEKAKYKLQFSPEEFFDSKGWKSINELDLSKEN